MPLKFEPNPNFRLDKEPIFRFLEKDVKRIILEQGCSLCKSKDLKITIQEFTPTRVLGHYHCKNCNHEQDVFFNHAFDEKLTEFENELKGMFKNSK